ncbi:MAG: hypothetical protein ACOX9R_13250 [Armatimonadota bacterium]|jgi:hypothetical protein
MTEDQLEIDSLREHLMRRWVTWGIAPLLLCALITGLLALWGPDGPIEGKQQTRLAFEIVFAVAAAVFLAGFYIDGHWTQAERLAKKIYRAAGGNEERNPRSWAQSGAHRSALRSEAAIALSSIRASADAITLMGITIGLVAIVSVVMGLPGEHAAQLLLLGACYQLFIFSRHPYYIRLAEAALDGQLLPRGEDEDKSQAEESVWRGQ